MSALHWLGDWYKHPEKGAEAIARLTRKIETMHPGARIVEIRSEHCTHRHATFVNVAFLPSRSPLREAGL